VIIFRELHGEDCLRGQSRDVFVERLAYYLGEVLVLHPFREGNGRAQRAFFAQLARSTGFTFVWQHLDAARNVETSSAIMRGHPEPIRKMPSGDRVSLVAAAGLPRCRLFGVR
jgi:cell filamentation protein